MRNMSTFLEHFYPKLNKKEGEHAKQMIRKILILNLHTEPPQEFLFS